MYRCYYWLYVVSSKYIAVAYSSKAGVFRPTFLQVGQLLRDLYYYT